MRRRLAAAGLFGLLLLAPGSSRVSAQLSEPCGTSCALVLGASSFTFATGTLAAVGRMRGGYSTTGQAIITWTTGLVVSVGAGLALHGDGGRQRRAVYGSGLGALGGAAVGVVLESALGESTATSRWAAGLVGAGLGVAVGGAIGAASYTGSPESTPSFTVTLPLRVPSR